MPSAGATFVWLSAFEICCFALLRSSSMKIKFVFEFDILYFEATLIDNHTLKTSKTKEHAEFTFPK